MKTRGTFTVAPTDWSGRAVCAQAGYRLPGADALWLDDRERSAQWIQLYRDRDYETRFENASLTSLRDQHNLGLDLQRVSRLVRWNADFDLKRRLINVHDVDGLIAADTLPWRTVEEFEVARDGLDDWRKSQRRVLKTLADYREAMAWIAGRGSRKRVGITTQNRLPSLAVATMLAAIYGAFGIEKAPYKTVARVWTALCGVPISETHIKDRKRRSAGPKELPESITDLSPEDESFARRLLCWRVEAWEILKLLCKPGSPATIKTKQLVDAVLLEDLANSDFDCMEPDYEPEEDIFDVDLEQNPTLLIDIAPSEFRNMRLHLLMPISRCSMR
jgi:hypothetical protein